MWWRIVLGVALLAGVSVPLAAGDDKDKAEGKEAKRSGTVMGTVTAKGEAWIEVKADGEEKARRYHPRWIGGAPKDGGGPDKEMVKAIREVKMDSRVRLQWEFEERPRVVKLEVLKAAKDKKDK